MQLNFVADKIVRLSRFVESKLAFVRRSFLQKLFRTKEIKLNGRPAKPVAKIQPGDKINIFLPDPRRNFGSITGCNILKEDINIIALDKRSGLAVASGVGTGEATVLVALEKLLKIKPILVHRLDRGTSGVIILAKNGATARKLEAEFRARRTKKIYHAIVSGRPRENSGVIKLPLQKYGQKMTIANSRVKGSRNNKQNDQTAPHSGGDPTISHTREMEHPRQLSAETRWKFLKKVGQDSLLEVQPNTGRTHQIRVHLAAIGHPIIGDDLYGTSNLKLFRLLLHASQLEILDYRLKAGLPREFLA